MMSLKNYTTIFWMNIVESLAVCWIVDVGVDTSSHYKSYYLYCAFGSYSSLPIYCSSNKGLQKDLTLCTKSRLKF